MPKAGNKRKKEEEADDDSTSDSGPDLEPPKKERESKSLKPAEKGKPESDCEQEARFALSKNKFVNVRTFKNHLQVDIREYYLNSKGDLLPGKKGISLNPEQWEQLKGVIGEIDAAILKRM